MLAGDARISGRISGDLIILGGTAALHGTAEITGDVRTSGGALTRNPEAVIGGSVTEDSNPARVLEQSREPRAPIEQVLWFLAGVATMAAFAWLAARLVPRPLRRTEAAATGFPVVSGALGSLVLITALPLMALMIFTLVLAPVALVVLLGLWATAVYGLLAVGRALGAFITHRLNRRWTMPPTAALGTAVFVTGLQLVGLVPVIGIAAVGIAVVVFVGASFLTGFGLRTYNPPDDRIDDDES